MHSTKIIYTTKAHVTTPTQTKYQIVAGVIYRYFASTITICQNKLPVYYYTNLLQVSVKLAVYWNLKQYTIQLQSFPAFLYTISNPQPRFHTWSLNVNEWETLRPISQCLIRDRLPNGSQLLLICDGVYVCDIFGIGFIWVISPKLTRNFFSVVCGDGHCNGCCKLLCSYLCV